VSEENQYEIIAKLLKRQKFQDVAQKYSSAYRADTGDTYGWVERGFSTELDKAFRLRPGDIFGPVKTADGIHAFRVAERKPFKVRSYAEARNEVVAEVTALREKALFAAWLDVQFKRYKVKKNKTVIDSIKVETQ
jgi:parvulin-like peptidyl-prolyl isomerase